MKTVKTQNTIQAASAAARETLDQLLDIACGADLSLRAKRLLAAMNDSRYFIELLLIERGIAVHVRGELVII